MRPSAAEVRQLPALLTTRVQPEWIDANGHMNVTYYLQANAAGTEVVCEDVGIDDAYRAERRMGIFTVEHNLRYFSELRLGEPLSVHVRVLERSDKAIHMMGLLVDDENHRLANILELMLVHVDMDTRTSIPIPDDVARGFDSHIQRGRTLNWDAPTYGAMRIRDRDNANG
jgi:acyl-CoA thioester hydrolase